MSKNAVRQLVVVLAVIATIAVNALAITLPLNGKNTGAISDSFHVFFVPAGYVFSIWGLIYLGLILYAVYQALPGQRDNAPLRRIGYLFVVSCLANIVWLFLWHYERFPLTLVAMLTLLVMLIAIYLLLDIQRTKVTAAERWLVHVPFSIYLGWITVATIANVTDVLYYVRWSGWGLSPQLWAVIMLLAGTAIAGLMGLTRRDIAYLAVIVWAFVGVAIKQASAPWVAVAAWIAAALVAAVLVWSAINRRDRVPA